MRIWRRVLLVCGVSVVLSLPLSCITTIFLNLRSDRVIRQWRQPKDINYKSYDPYVLSVIEGSREWNDLSFPRRHYLFIGRDDEAPSYGHYLDYSFHAGIEEVNAHIAKSQVQWRPEGVTFIEATGHRLFVPKAMFIGGR